ncbi:MAG TPA: heme lyase CcmF/NrfE family subunit [Beijerinckiaceae bacterium]|nr:heme lyase CcmF/NrfE family subunit [Beijerinckiaceae bacterium]
MTVEVGHYALVLAFALALIQAVLPLWGSIKGDAQLMAVAPPAAVMQFVLVAVSFAALVHAHVVSDFSLVNVVENSHSAKPLIYKITGVWGNHEGSMLLWVLILTLFGALVALFSRAMPEDLRAATLAMQAWISAAFLIFILLTSNPFARMWPAPIQGDDLNPLLQDPGLAIHPPLLYLGYVGLSITFSFAAAALISGRIDAAWARSVRPWTLIAWIFLTLGIAMGSYWSYYTLGWGGFWFWDPVENASLMPWLAATALLHSAAVMEKREALKIWTIFLAVLAFSLSLLGTFLVRSGVLTSVHAFAVDPRRGVFILVILVFFIGGSLGLFAWRAPMLKPGGIFAPVSREGALVLNNLLLTTCCATVVIGTLYPLGLQALTGEKISVGAPFFNLTFVPLFIPIFLAMPLGQTLAWKRGDLLGAAQRVTVAAAIGGAVALGFAVLRGGPVFSPIGVGIAAYLIIGAFVEVFGRVIGRGGSLGSAFARARGLPRSAWGTAFAHAGIGVTLFGLAATGWGVDKILAVRPGESLSLGPYSVEVGQIAKSQGPNYTQTALPMTVRSGTRKVAEIAPSRRSFPVRQMNVSEAGIATIGFGQVYVSLGDPNANGSYDARLYWKPFVALIWLGALVMAFGGAVSLSDRRLRIGAARRATARTPPVARPQPAE